MLVQLEHALPIVVAQAYLKKNHLTEKPFRITFSLLSGITFLEAVEAISVFDASTCRVVLLVMASDL